LDQGAWQDGRTQEAHKASCNFHSHKGVEKGSCKSFTTELTGTEEGPKAKTFYD